jgi:hypothetical protein
MNVLSAVTPPCVPLNFEKQVLKEYNEVARDELFLEILACEEALEEEHSHADQVGDVVEHRRENRRESYSKLSQALRRARISYDAANRGVEDVSPDVQTNVDPEELDQHVPATTRMIKIDIDQIKPQLSEVTRSFEYRLLNAQTT